ncbi:MAG: T9SS type A sorting domain-containing protein, partial [Candidatus Latescibacteria bacterium]|nr:T9SS type A sorting domain-containing protein [bacterium]MBD3423221.1 T9SS type A sorting domain-containing protein [Candidatus Latescibacterota bacterium]
DGTNWTEHDSSGVMFDDDLNGVYFVGTNGWICGDDGNVWYSTDDGVTWTSATDPFTDDIMDIKFKDASNGYAAGDGDGIMYTTDGGANWTQAAANLGPYPYTRTDIECIHVVNDTTMVASGWGSLIGPQPTIILVSTDSGLSWGPADATYSFGTYTYGYDIDNFADNELIIVGGGSGSSSISLNSTDLGDNWAPNDAFYGEDLRFCAVVPGTDRVFAGGDEGCLAISKNRGQDWTFVQDPGNGFGGWLDITECVFVGDNGSIMTTSNFEMGVIAPEYFAPDIYAIATRPSNVWYACGSNDYLCKSTDGGETWTQLRHSNSFFEGIYDMYWFDDDNGVLVGEWDRVDVIYTTSDGGATLNNVFADSVHAQFNGVSFARENELIGVAVGDDSVVVHTTDGGATWSVSSFTNAADGLDLEEVFMATPSNGFLVGDDGLYATTTNGGATWTVQTAFTNEDLIDVYFSSSTVGWISGDDNDVWWTDDGGSTWTDIDLGMAYEEDVNAVYYDWTKGVLWAGTDNGYIVKRNDLTPTDTETPKSLPFALMQNYPNPFNPSTSIKFSLPKDSFVSLNVYDVTGKLVAEILNKDMDKGEYTVGFKADNLASGVYFYRLETGYETLSRKMILLR